MSNSKTTFIHYALTFLYFISFLLIVYFLVIGADFYSTSLSDRPHHAAYRNLRPAGLTGHAFGVIGSAMMIFMLFYSIRKRVRILQKVGYLSSWLRVHIYFGVIGPMLIILHSSFKVQGLIAVSFWSMIAVALSGVLGRYLYKQIPRTIAGKEIDFNELDQMDQNLAQEIHSKFQIEIKQLESIEASIFPPIRPEKGLFVAFISMIYNDTLKPIRSYRLKKYLQKKLNLSSHAVNQMLVTVKRKAMLQRRISMWNATHQLFHYWHVFHKPFAIIMYIIMLVHIMVAVYVGYAWIF